jgi:NAD+ diphosphatase
VYLFWGSNLVLPESISDDEAARGVDRAAADKAFGAPCYYAVPVLEPNGRTALNGSPPEEPALCFLLDDDIKLPPQWRAIAIRQLLPRVDESIAVRILRAYHVIQWRRDSRYCGSCGGANGDSPDELARLCPRCGRLEYPRISPAVIVLITDGKGGALLAHNKKFRERMYSLIAGFVEAGESLESAVHREIKEELDIEVTDIRYVSSQSWPFPNAIMLGFTARFARGNIKPDGVEIIDARWFSRETIKVSAREPSRAEDPTERVPGAALESGIPELPSRGSIARHIIEKWLGGNLQ